MEDKGNTIEYIFSFNQKNTVNPTVDDDKNNQSNEGAEGVPVVNSFEDSLNRFSSSDIKKKKKKKKRGLGVYGISRMLVFCLCIGVLMYSMYMIIEKFDGLSISNAINNQAENIGKNSLIPKLNFKGNLSPSRDLLTFLGSDHAGLDEINPETRNEYEERRQQLLDLQSAYPDCNFYGYITVSDTAISYPIMKYTDNDFYLDHLFNGQKQPGGTGAIFADYRLKDNYDENMNMVIYGHCMTDGSMFRPIKYFFDSEFRNAQAQNMKITVVTLDGVYIYDFFASYRSEGDDFIKRYTTKSDKDRYYSFLKRRRRLNVIDKQVSYNENSKIITLVTCTNISSMPNERYVLHGILSKSYSFSD